MPDTFFPRDENQVVLAPALFLVAFGPFRPDPEIAVLEDAVGLGIDLLGGDAIGEDRLVGGQFQQPVMLQVFGRQIFGEDATDEGGNIALAVPAEVAKVLRAAQQRIDAPGILGVVPDEAGDLAVGAQIGIFVGAVMPDDFALKHRSELGLERQIQLLHLARHLPGIPALAEIDIEVNPRKLGKRLPHRVEPAVKLAGDDVVGLVGVVGLVEPGPAAGCRINQLLVERPGLGIVFGRVDVDAAAGIEILHPLQGIVELGGTALAAADIVIVGMGTVMALGLIALELEILAQTVGIEINHLDFIEHRQERMLRLAGEIHRDLADDRILHLIGTIGSAGMIAVGKRPILPVHLAILVAVAGHHHLAEGDFNRLVPLLPQRRQPLLPQVQSLRRLHRAGPPGPGRIPDMNALDTGLLGHLRIKALAIDHHIVDHRGREFARVDNHIGLRLRLVLGLGIRQREKGIARLSFAYQPRHRHCRLGLIAVHRQDAVIRELDRLDLAHRLVDLRNRKLHDIACHLRLDSQRQAQFLHRQRPADQIARNLLEQYLRRVFLAIDPNQRQGFRLAKQLRSRSLPGIIDNARKLLVDGHSQILRADRRGPGKDRQAAGEQGGNCQTVMIETVLHGLSLRLARRIEVSESCRSLVYSSGEP